MTNRREEESKQKMKNFNQSGVSTAVLWNLFSFLIIPLLRLRNKVYVSPRVEVYLSRFHMGEKITMEKVAWMKVYGNRSLS